MPGQFISFEGIDGAGKSTHIEAVANWLRAQGHEVILTREPGGTPLAERLRELVLHTPMDATTEALLVFAARRDHIVQHIEPALARGATVLCDRFCDSSFAYQGGGRGFDWEILEHLEHWTVQGLQPNLTMWFDIPADIAARRRSSVRAPDRFEAQDIEFFTRVRSGYLRRVAACPGRFATVDATGTADVVRTRVLAVVSSRVLPCLDPDGVGPLLSQQLSTHGTGAQEHVAGGGLEGRRNDVGEASKR